MASSDGTEFTNPGDWRIPAIVAAVAWFASAIAVIGYTFIAFKETMSGSGSDINANPPGKGGPTYDERVRRGEVAGPPTTTYDERVRRGEVAGPPSPDAPTRTRGRKKYRR